MKDFTKEASDDFEDSVDMIIDAFHDQYDREYFEGFINCWSKEKTNIPNLKAAISFIYKAVNYDREDYVNFLSKNFGDEYSNDRKFLNIISKHCVDDINKDSKYIWGHCRRISSLPDDELKKKISNYFQKKSNNFLQEKYPAIFEDCQNKFNKKFNKEEADELPSSVVSKPESSGVESSEKQRT